MLATYIPSLVKAVSKQRDGASYGDGIRMAQQLGANLKTMTHISVSPGLEYTPDVAYSCIFFFPFSILAGSGYELKSFVIGVMGGLGNPIGALLGGLILGVLEGVIPAFLETSWVPVIEFGLFVVILLVRPGGLIGAKK